MQQYQFNIGGCSPVKLLFNHQFASEGEVYRDNECIPKASSTSSQKLCILCRTSIIRYILVNSNFQAVPGVSKDNGKYFIVLIFSEIEPRKSPDQKTMYAYVMCRLV